MIVAALVLLAAAAPPVSESVILGDWCAGATGAFHQEFSLEIEESKRIFSSWLHQRPALHGTWALKGRTLTIRGVNGGVMTYHVVSASRKRLVLRNEERRREVYVRHGRCVAFDAPPDGL